MDLQTFIYRIKNTILLIQERKNYFLANAEKYPPELRAGMITELEKHEKEYIEFGKNRIKEIKKEKADSLHDKMMKLETKHKKEHLKEIEKAEAQLENDLANLNKNA